jgi:hypothetical protein
VVWLGWLRLKKEGKEMENLERVKKLVEAKHLKNQFVCIAISERVAEINIKDGRVSVSGDDLLVVECLKELNRTIDNKISKLNANLYLNRQERGE